MPRALLFICAGLLAPLILGAGEVPSAKAPPRPTRAMWVWDASIVGNPEEEERLFAFCKHAGVSVLFFDATPQLRDPTQFGGLRAFVRAARGRGLGVHALFGEPTWVLPDHHKDALAWLARLDAYHQEATESERFAGAQWDVEPYVLPEWKTDPHTLASEYLALVDKLLARHQALSKAHPLAFSAAVPFWWDQDGPESVFVAEGEHERPLLQCLFGKFKAYPRLPVHLAVMAYRTYARGPNSVTEISRQEIDAANATQGQVRVWVGLESGKTDPASITFFGHPWRELAQTADEVDAFLRGKRSYAGVALHHYRALVALSGSPVEKSKGDAR